MKKIAKKSVDSMGKQNSSVLKLVTLLPFFVIAFVTGSEIFDPKQV